MSVIVKDVENNSPAERAGILPGSLVLRINSNEINDVLDYRFYIKEEILNIDIKDTDGKFRKLRVEKKAEEDLGLQFETYLMDKQQHCKNKCIFCFIDQLPEGMRDSLYFKDDDSRLSFLFGNYITLTNLGESDVDRIIQMHISPVNISVHTMNPELRVKMMKNPKAGECLSIIRRLADAGIKINTQLVLCPGINDGKELEYSLNELGKLYPAVQSIAAVPVGLTKYRDGLCSLEGYNKETASQVIDIIECFADHFNYFNGTRLAFAADEFYLLAEREIHDAEYYEDFAQIENGVGLWASLRDEFYSALEDVSEVNDFRNVAIATGNAAYPLICQLAAAVSDKCKNIKVDVFEISNRFFGESITVAGLVVGEDLISQLKDKLGADELLIPSVMLRHERDMFLDSITVEQAEKELNTKIIITDVDGYDLLDKILGRQGM